MTTYPTGIDSAILQGVDSILGIRDAIGAIIKPIFFVTRTFYKDAGKTVPATQPEGSNAKDVVVQVLPTPGMKQFNQDIRLREGGSIKAGDIILKGISKNLFKEKDLDGSTSAKNIQKLYLIGDKLYQVINVYEKHVTFNVQVRELTNQARY